VSPPNRAKQRRKSAAKENEFKHSHTPIGALDSTLENRVSAYHAAFCHCNPLPHHKAGSNCDYMSAGKAKGAAELVFSAMTPTWSTVQRSDRMDDVDFTAKRTTTGWPVATVDPNLGHSQMHGGPTGLSFPETDI
jgi:hypothetical protein